jgi:hypothetical protein
MYISGLLQQCQARFAAPGAPIREAKPGASLALDASRPDQPNFTDFR